MKLTEERQTKHDLKCWMKPFAALKSGEKTHEIRVNDRDFRVDDFLLLHEWDEWSSRYTGHTLKFLVTYISEGGKFGLPENLVVMSVMKIPGEQS